MKPSHETVIDMRQDIPPHSSMVESPQVEVEQQLHAKSNNCHQEAIACGTDIEAASMAESDNHQSVTSVDNTNESNITASVGNDPAIVHGHQTIFLWALLS